MNSTLYFTFMKHLLTLLLLIPSLVRSQYQYLKLENSHIIFERIYSVDSTLNKDEVEKMLTLNVPKISGITQFTKTPEIITANLANVDIDYRKYGGKWVNTAVFLNYPMFGQVSIVWKPAKYKVTVAGMYFDTHTSLGLLKCDDILTSKKGSQFNIQQKTVITGGGYLERYLDELFYIKSSGETW
jgi:hypothetical protein